MMLRKSIFAIAVLCLIMVALSACAEPTVDASTTETLKTSVDKMREALSPDQRPQFDEAIQVLTYSQIDVKSIMNDGDSAVAKFEGRVKATLNGKTAEQIMADASAMIAERQRREKEQALQEIAELEKRKQDSVAAREQLKAFEVSRTRFYKREQEYGQPQPIIEMTVKNNTGHPVARAFFEGTLASPGRSVPWLQKAFNYPISGGIEPGEEATWALAPNQFSEWGTVQVPDDAILTVTVERLDGADGQSLFTKSKFTDDDQTRLDLLKKQYGEK